MLVVAPDVAHQLACKVLHRSEDAASDHVALDLGEPDLDLIQPRRVGRREVEVQSRMICEEALDVTALVDREVVEDDVDLTLAAHAREKTLEEGHEGRAVVLLDGGADDLARARVQRGKERQGPVPVVLEAVPLQAPWRQRQDRIQAVERLDLRLLVQREDSRVLGRVQIQPDHVGGLALEVRIVRDHVALGPMRLDRSPAPDSLDQHVADPKLPGQLAGAPVGRAVRGLALGTRQDPCLHPRRHRRRLATLVPGVHPRHAMLEEATPPAADVGTTAAKSLLNAVVGFAVGQHQDHPRATRFIGSTAARANASLEYLSVLSCKSNGIFGAHA